MQIEITAVEITKQSSESDLKHQSKGGFELLMRQNRAESLERRLCERMHAGDA